MGHAADEVAGSAGGLGAAYFIWRYEQRRPADFRALVATIEQENPKVRHLLATAAEQESDESGRFGFLQLRVIDQALMHRDQIFVGTRLQKQRFSSAANLNMLALLALLFTLCPGGNPAWWHTQPGSTSLLAEEITVAPGDTQVERGTGLVITARFGHTPPAEATLVVVSASKTQRIPLARCWPIPFSARACRKYPRTDFIASNMGRKKPAITKLAFLIFPR